MDDNICIFISSSDNTKDVFFQVWKNKNRLQKLGLKTYVGLNTYDKEISSLGFSIVTTQKKSWQAELYQQLKMVKENYILLFLDDFLVLSEPEVDRVHKYIDIVINKKIIYFRCIPHKRNIFMKYYSYIKNLIKKNNYEIIPKSDPYFSSLQVSIWEKKYLIDLLKSDVSIWDFEHINREASVHYAVIGKPLFNYNHVVEKGEWIYNYKRLFYSAGKKIDIGGRGAQLNSLTNHLKNIFGKIKFFIFGYSIYKLKKW